MNELATGHLGPFEPQDAEAHRRGLRGRDPRRVEHIEHTNSAQDLLVAAAPERPGDSQMPLVLVTDDRSDGLGPAVASFGHRRIAVTVCGGLVDVLDALAFLEGEPPYQLVNDVVRSWLAEAAQDPGVRSAVTALRRRRAQLSLARAELAPNDGSASDA